MRAEWPRTSMIFTPTVEFTASATVSAGNFAASKQWESHMGQGNGLPKASLATVGMNLPLSPSLESCMNNAPILKMHLHCQKDGSHMKQTILQCTFAQ